MKQYQDIIGEILQDGVDRIGRNGDTRALFSIQMRFDLNDGFPAVTTKKLFIDSVVKELIWFLSGSNDVKDLQEMGCHIWDANAKDYSDKGKAKFPGDVGRTYGIQWRRWKSPWVDKPIDQLGQVIENIRRDPNSRYHIINAWNPGEKEMTALPWCHTQFQFFVAEEKISLDMSQRSCDMFLGVPFNIASYALLLHIVAQITNLEPYELIINLKDAHIYRDHFPQVEELLTREPYPSPKLYLSKEIDDIDYFTRYIEKKDWEGLKKAIEQSIRLDGYQHHPAIKAEMMV